jgi:hypothetical protein
MCRCHAVAVVVLPLGGVRKNLVGLLHAGEPGRGIGRLVDIRVQLARELAVGGSDLIRGGGALHAKEVVIVGR